VDARGSISFTDDNGHARAATMRAATIEIIGNSHRGR
jgi:hypothetical protein